MAYRYEGYDLSVQYDARNYEISSETKDRIEEDLEPLANVVRSFPTAALHCEIVRHPRSNQFHTKMSLRLMRDPPLFTAERDAQLTPTIKRCVRKLIHKVEAYKERLDGARMPVAGSVRAPTKVVATGEPRLEDLRDAAERLDYRRFRELIGTSYTRALDQRIGRWVERYPEATALLGDELLISEIREEVFLNAFERWSDRPRPPESLGEWLESLIDPSLRMLLEQPETEKENLSYVRTLLETPREEK